MLIGINDFVRRQTPESEFAHFDGSFENVVSMTKFYFDRKVPGYRDGVVLVPVFPFGFFSSVINLKGNQDANLHVEFKPRAEGEDPYLHVFAKGEKSPAKKVEIVLYRHDVLAENNEQSTDAEWEIVSINATCDMEKVPMCPMTRARNILEMTGGTSTKLQDKSKDELIQLIKDMASEVVYWNQHVFVK